MAKFFDHINDKIKKFISEQHIFFVSTAPDNGRINLSPKGMDSFRVLGDNKVAFLNVTGSGNETAAHLVQNSRMTIMFCSFTASPLILRLYGQGQAIHDYDANWDEMLALFPPIIGARQVIVCDVESVQTSCGYAVPRMDFREERQTLIKWTEAKSDDQLQIYWEQKNVTSIDGDPTFLLEKRSE
ncbi:MAG: pyridoxamine 5'-phosphate oxidase family protein [Chloroflexota bacterium]